MSTLGNFPEPEGEGDDLDLGIFQDALDHLEGEEQKTINQSIRDVLDELSKKYGFQYHISDGRQLGQPMSFNHRLDDFRHFAGGINDDIALAMQSNKFTYEMKEEVLNLSCVPETLRLKTDAELANLQRVNNSLLEVLLYLGYSKYDGEHEYVGHLKNEMIRDIKSYDLMIATFTEYADFIQDYINTRYIENSKLVDLPEIVGTEIKREIEKLSEYESEFPGSTQKLTKVIQIIQNTLSNRGNNELVLMSEARMILRALNDSVAIRHDDHLDKFVPIINYKMLNRCIELIASLDGNESATNVILLFNHLDESKQKHALALRTWTMDEFNIEVSQLHAKLVDAAFEVIYNPELENDFIISLARRRTIRHWADELDLIKVERILLDCGFSSTEIGSVVNKILSYMSNDEL